MSQTPNDAANGAAVVTDPPAVVPGADGAPAATPPASAYAAPPADVTPPAVVPLPERIPEKYRVNKEDGTFDLEASTAKMLDGHAALEKRLGTGDAPPKDADSYEPKTERFDIEELKNDEKYKGWLKGAHAKGMTNDQVGYVLDSFADRLSEIAGPAPMTVEQFRAEVEPHFAELGGYNEGIKLGIRAAKAFLPGVTDAEIATLPNHPLVARLLAAVGKEVGEDTPVGQGAISPSDFDSEVAAIKASEAYNKATHPEHQQALDKMKELYARRYGTKPQVLGVGATVQSG